MSFDADTLAELKSGLENGKIFRPFDEFLKEHHCYWQLHNMSYFGVEHSKLVLYRFHPRELDGVSEFLANITMRFNSAMDQTVYFESWPDGGGPIVHSKLMDAVKYCELYAASIIKSERYYIDNRDAYFEIWQEALENIGFSYNPDSDLT